MKILKSISILACIIFLFSCQVDDKSSIEYLDQSASEIKLIDESYAIDLESFKNVPIMIDNVQYDIKDILTDPSLFNKYESAEIHHLEQNADTKTLYVIANDAEDKLILPKIVKARALARKGLMKNNVVSLVRLWQNINFKGVRYRFNVDADISRSTAFLGRLPSRRKKKSKSMKWDVEFQENKVTLAEMILIGDNGKTSAFTTIKSPHTTKFANLAWQTVKNNNVVEVDVSFIIL